MPAHALTGIVPLGRTDDIIVTDLTDHLLIFNQQSNELHNLDAVSRAVWLACDGVTAMATLPAMVGEATGQAISAETVSIALSHLADRGLLAGTALVESAEIFSVPGQSRRALLRKAAAGVLVPAIVSVTVPMAAAAASCGNGALCCDGVTQCLPGAAGCCGSQCRFSGQECCGGEIYSPSTHGCCGVTKYSLSTQTCCNGTINEGSGLACCGTQGYNPSINQCCSPHNTICSNGLKCCGTGCAQNIPSYVCCVNESGPCTQYGQHCCSNGKCCSSGPFGSVDGEGA